jgi:hypothetical protein
MTMYQPATRHARRSGLKTVLAVGIPAVVLIAVGVGLIVPRLTGGTGGGSFIPGIAGPGGGGVGGGGSKDPGVAACEAMRDAPKATATPKPEDLDMDAVAEAFRRAPEGYKELRTRFEASRVPALRDSGTRFVDAGLKLFEPRGPEEYEETLTALAEQGMAYQDLSAACAEQGVTIPPIPAANES